MASDQPSKPVAKSKTEQKSKPFRPSAAHAKAIASELARLYPHSRCALDYRNLYELIVATILSAQCTDKRVNMVTPSLFSTYPTPADLAQAEQADLEKIIHSTGFYKAKAKNLIAMAKGLVLNHNGQVPENIEALTKLAGVGRKTANVVLGVGLGITSGIVVDTHVTRISRRLGLTKQASATGIEKDLVKSIPKSDWVLISLRMIDHGRAVCKAGRPACNRCGLEPVCPKIGVIQPSTDKPAERSNKTRAAEKNQPATKPSIQDTLLVKGVAKPGNSGKISAPKPKKSRAVQ